MNKKWRDERYLARVRECAKVIEADGCSGVPDFFKICCDAHDITYRTGADVDGEPRSQAEGDAELRQCIQARSRWGWFSPMSWWRWAVLRVVGHKSYRPRFANCPELIARKRAEEAEAA